MAGAGGPAIAALDISNLTNLEDHVCESFTI